MAPTPQKQAAAEATKPLRTPNRWIRPNSYLSNFLSSFGFTPRVREKITGSYRDLLWDFGPFVFVVIFIFPDILDTCFSDWYRWGARDAYIGSKRK